MDPIVTPFAERILAPLLSLALFLLWTGVGLAVLSALRLRLRGAQQELLAPAIGASVVVLAVFWPNWLGLPVAVFAGPLVGVLCGGAAVALWFRRADIRWPSWRAALPALAAAFVLSGWPLVAHGFSWLAYANSDMASYCLMAARILQRGLTVAPTAAELTASEDLSLNSWLFEINLARPGSHLLVAFAAALLKRNPVEVYMPVLISVHVALVAATGALVWRDDERGSRARRLALWLMAGSALSTLGVVNQLLPQVLGLTLGCAVLLLAWDCHEIAQPGRRAAALAIVSAAFLLTYAEFVPFVVVPLVARILLSGALWRGHARPTWIAFAATCVGAFLLIAPYLERLPLFFLHQALHGSRVAVSGAVETFPHFRLTTGIANLWGLLPLAGSVREPWLSVAVVMALVCCVWMLAQLPRLVRRSEPAGYTLAFMTAVWLVLAQRGSGFGLFKLAMYLQPYLVAAVGLAVTSARAPRFSAATAALLFGAGLYSQGFYALTSIDGPWTRAPIRQQQAMMAGLHDLASRHSTTIEVDVPSVVPAKLVALYSRDNPLRFGGLRPEFRFRSNRETTPARYWPDAERLSNVIAGLSAPAEFPLHDPARPDIRWSFGYVHQPDRAPPAPSCDLLMTLGPNETLLNRSITYDTANGAPLQSVPCSAAVNHLIFVSSSLGRHYYLAANDPVGLFAMEGDPFFPGRTMAAVGRYLLFEVLNPTDEIRVLVDLTSSFKGDGQNSLPPVHVIGHERVAVGMLGRGSARVLSPPVRPLWIKGRAYIGIDMGVDGRLYPYQRRGLLALWGKDVPLDSRKVVAIARNIDAIGGGEATNDIPSSISSFPAALGQGALQYSGIYEDGWTAETAHVRLARPLASNVLLVEGMALSLPLGETMRVSVSVDGSEVYARELPAGEFSLRLHVPPSPGPSVVTVNFSGVTRLAPPDTRPASALLTRMAFEAGER